MSATIKKWLCALFDHDDQFDCAWVTAPSGTPRYPVFTVTCRRCGRSYSR